MCETELQSLVGLL